MTFLPFPNWHNIRLLLWYGIGLFHDGFELTHATGTADAGILGPRLPPEPVRRVAVLVPVNIHFGD